MEAAILAAVYPTSLIAKNNNNDFEIINSIITRRMLSVEIEIPKNIELLYRPKGCLKCTNTGYKGRIGVFEILTISPETEKMILNSQDLSVL